MSKAYGSIIGKITSFTCILTHTDVKVTIIFFYANGSETLFSVDVPGGGGARFSSNTSHLIWKQTVNTTLAMGHQDDLRTARNFIFYR